MIEITGSGGSKPTLRPRTPPIKSAQVRHPEIAGANQGFFELHQENLIVDFCIVDFCVCPITFLYSPNRHGLHFPLMSDTYTWLDSGG